VVGCIRESFEITRLLVIFLLTLTIVTKVLPVGCRVWWAPAWSEWPPMLSV
jgi:hypothetical protein